MKIKHMPSGLFPHFDSGLERRPYFVKAGDMVAIGCRLDDSEAGEIYMEVSDQSGVRLVKGRCHSSDSRGQRYFRFDYQVEQGNTAFSYRFVSADGGSSQRYECPVLREITLFPRIEYSGNSKRLVYQSDTQEYRIEILSSPCIRIIFYSNLTVKIKDKSDRLKTIREKICIGGHNGADVLRVGPELTLMVDREGGVHNLRLRLELPGKAVYGMGEKFDAVDQRGKRPLNYVVEQFAHQGDKTYLPIPFFFTDAGVSFLQKTSYPTAFDFSREAEDGWIGMELFACCPQEGVLFEASVHTGSPDRLLKAYAGETGEAVLPPKWAFGPWMSSNGWNTQREAMEQLRQMRDTAIPATVMVLEAWSDEETFYIWNDAKYTPRKGGGPFRYGDFEFGAEGKWPDPKGFCESLEREGVKLILWQISVIKYEAGPHGAQLDLDWEYARENNLCLKNGDGTPYHITEMWFGNSLIPDFTNPKTREWWLDCRRYLVEELGVAGFKTDGGEFLFDPDASFSDGRTVAEAHNEFPNLYEGVYRELLSGHGGITFSRAGYTGAQRYPIHWAGDQVSEFSELKAQLTAGLSAGLSGIPFWGFDLGGFAGDFPSTELYLRAAAFAAFAPVMQFHSEPRGGQYCMVARSHWNNDRSPWNMAAANQDDTIIPVYRLFANLRMNLLPYIWQEAQHAGETLRPMMAHLIYDFCGDPLVLGVEDEYMFGRDLLVAPVVTEGAQGRDVYLPEGAWYDLWNGGRFEGKQTVQYACPLERIPVFVREGKAIPVNLNAKFYMGTREKEGAVSNRLDSYENLCFLLFGEQGRCSFRDEMGSALTLEWGAQGETVRGSAAYPITLFRMGGGDRGPVLGTLFGRPVRGERKEPQ